MRFIFSEEDLVVLSKIKSSNFDYLVDEYVEKQCNSEIVDSSTRLGYFLLKADRPDELLQFMPKERF